MPRGRGRGRPRGKISTSAGSSGSKSQIGKGRKRSITSGEKSAKKRKVEVPNKGNSRSTSSSNKKSTSPNQDIIDLFNEIALFERETNVYKSHVYVKAISSLKNLKHRVKDIEEAKTLDGIGDSLAHKIQEILDTGHLRELDEIRIQYHLAEKNELCGVHGIGPATADKLVDEGISTIEDLRKNESLLNNVQKIGLEYYEDFQKKIPRTEVKTIADIVTKEILKVDPEFTVKICGSYRRGKAFSGDIDILVVHPEYKNEASKKDGAHVFEDLIYQLLDKKIIVRKIVSGAVKFQGIINLKEMSNKIKKDVKKEILKNAVNRKIDIRILPKESLICGVFYFTGSKDFNNQIRLTARNRGYHLNEYCLKKSGENAVPEKIRSERQIFKIINEPYVKPKDRD